MADLIVRNRVGETTSNQPTAGGSSTLSGALDDHVAFNGRVPTSDQTVVLRAAPQGNASNDWEIVLATFITPDQILVDLYLDSSTGSLIDWSTVGVAPTCQISDVARFIHPRRLFADISVSTANLNGPNALVSDTTYLLEWCGVFGSSSSDNLVMEASSNGGTSFITSGYQSQSAITFQGGSIAGDQSTTHIILSENVGTIAANNSSGYAWISGANDATRHFDVVSDSVINDAPDLLRCGSCGRLASATNVDFFRVRMDNGNLLGGQFFLTAKPSVSQI